MQEIEDKIIQRFDEQSGIFPEDINLGDFRVKKLLKFLGAASGKKILDLGCGKGRFCKIIKNSGFINIVGVDPSVELVKAAKLNNKDIKFIEASATSLSFHDGEFDILVCIEVLEHIPDTEKAIKEMSRVLKPGGRILVLDKNILSLHPVYFVPTFIWKSFLESINKWFYPKNFIFKEKYFVPWELNKTIKKYFSNSKVSFIRYEIENNNRQFFIKSFISMHNIVSLVFYKVFPFFNFFIVWEGVK